MKREMSPGEKIMFEELRHNAIIFFKDFIDRIQQDDGHEDLISKEMVILSVSSLQIALELAFKAAVLKKLGIKTIVKDISNYKSEEEIFAAFETNSLKTIGFEQIKHLVKKQNLVSGLTDDDLNIVNDFQRYRNGMVHFSYKFDHGDYFDLKYDIIYFVVSVLIKALRVSGSADNPGEVLEYDLGSEYHKKLSNYPPFILAMEQMAREHSDIVYNCFICSQKTYAQSEQYCYCCNFYGNLYHFRACEYCGHTDSMIYDGLNLSLNKYETKARCLNCLTEARVFFCPACENSYNLDNCMEGSSICRIDACIYLL